MRISNIQNNRPTQKINNSRKQNVSFGNIYKAFLIKGGSEASRLARATELRGNYLNYGIFTSPDGKKIVQIATDNPDDLCAMTFVEARKLAGSFLLRKDYTLKSPKQTNQGVIDLGKA